MRLKFPIFIQKFAKKAQLKCSVRAISIAPYRTFRGPLKFLNIRVSGKHMGSNVCPEVRRELLPLNFSLSYVHDVLLQVLYEKSFSRISKATSFTLKGCGRPASKEVIAQISKGSSDRRTPTRFKEARNERRFWEFSSLRRS